MVDLVDSIWQRICTLLQQMTSKHNKTRDGVKRN